MPGETIVIKNKSLMKDLILKLEDIIFLHTKYLKSNFDVIQILSLWQVCFFK